MAITISKPLSSKIKAKKKKESICGIAQENYLKVGGSQPSENTHLLPPGIHTLVQSSHTVQGWSVSRIRQKLQYVTFDIRVIKCTVVLPATAFL